SEAADVICAYFITDYHHDPSHVLGNYSVTNSGNTLTVNPATPTVTVSDGGGTFDGQPFAATDTVAGVISGVDSTPSSSLEGVSPTLSYYIGSSASGTALSAAPSTAG